MAGFFEDEAELGSENEENDHHIKNINKRDAEEDEEGLDEDLKDFVHIPGDNEEIPDNASDVHRRYMEDLREDDLKFNKKMLEKGLFGRKRKFDDKDEDEEDSFGNYDFVDKDMASFFKNVKKWNGNEGNHEHDYSNEEQLDDNDWNSYSEMSVQYDE